jgi:WD40 repeat protein
MWDLCSGRCVKTIEGHTKSISSVALSADGRWALSGSGTHLRLWELEWDYEFPERKNWDEGARPHLEIFLTLHCAVGGDGVTRVGKPNWKDEDFQKLLTDLQYRNYGWLRPEGVRRELEKMTAEWQGPQPSPWERGN